MGESQALQRRGDAELLEEARRLIPGASLGTYMMPEDGAFVIAEGRGSKVYDLEGREYIDCILGGGPLILGHAHPAVVEAIQRQAERGSQFLWLTEPTIALAKKIVAAVPCAEAVKFTSSGAEATFYALRLARAFTGRDKIMRFRGGYHGHHDYGMAGRSAGIPRAVADLVITAPFNDLETTTRLIEQHRHELAAVIVEPLQRIIPPKPGFLQGLREVTKLYGIVLVFDEIVTGFRLAWGGAQERYGVVPDLATFGKIIGGGLPMAAVAGRADIMALADPRDRGKRYVYFSGTLSGYPLGAAAGLATLGVLEQPGAYERLNAIGERVRDGLRDIAASLPRPLQVLGGGPVVGLAFTDGDVSRAEVVQGSDAAADRALEDEMLRLGVLMHLGSKKFYLSSAHSDSDLDRTLEALDGALRTVCAARQGG